jgi:hypothetical protein
LSSIPPPSEPDWRISRIRLSGQWVTSLRAGKHRLRSHRVGHSAADASNMKHRLSLDSPAWKHKNRVELSVVHSRTVPTYNSLAAFESADCDSLLQCPSTSLRPFAPSPLQGLLRLYGRSDSCPAGSSVPYWLHEHRLFPDRSPSFTSLIFRSLRLQPPVNPLCRFSTLPLSSQGFPFGSGFHLYSAGSPSLTGRIEFVILRMDRSPPAAPHPASRRRSCIRLQAGERMPGEDFHLSG